MWEKENRMLIWSNWIKMKGFGVHSYVTLYRKKYDNWPGIDQETNSSEWNWLDRRGIGCFRSSLSHSNLSIVACVPKRDTLNEIKLHWESLKIRASHMMSNFFMIRRRFDVKTHCVSCVFFFLLIIADTINKHVVTIDCKTITMFNSVRCS